MTFPTINPSQIFSSSAYCKTAICDKASVLPGEYNPWMILPLAIKDLDPEFADCDIPDGYTWFDPPIVSLPSIIPRNDASIHELSTNSVLINTDVVL